MCQHKMLNLKFSQIRFKTSNLFFSSQKRNCNAEQCMPFSWKIICQHASFVKILARFYLVFHEAATGPLSSGWRVKHYLHFIVTFRNHKTTRWNIIGVKRDRENKVVVWNITKQKRFKGGQLDEVKRSLVIISVWQISTNVFDCFSSPVIREQFWFLDFCLTTFKWGMMENLLLVIFQCIRVYGKKVNKWLFMSNNIFTEHLLP